MFLLMRGVSRKAAERQPVFDDYFFSTQARFGLHWGSQHPYSNNPKVPMKKSISIMTLMMVASSLMAADSPKDAVTAAAKKLAASDNYSWTTTSTNVAPPGGAPGGPGGGRGRGFGGFGGGPTEGKAEKDGYVLITTTQGPNTTLTLLKGTNGAIKAADAQWQSFAEATQDDGNGGFNPARFLVMRMQSFASPAAEVQALIGQLGDVTMADGVYSGALTEEGAKARMAFPGRGGFGGGNGPEITGAKGSAKFWITDGVLTKYELNVQGKIDFNGNGIDRNTTTTTEIKDVGKTKVEAPDDAKKKVS
jgi:hypothetical protein